MKMQTNVCNCLNLLKIGNIKISKIMAGDMDYALGYYWILRTWFIQAELL